MRNKFWTFVLLAVAIIVVAFMVLLIAPIAEENNKANKTASYMYHYEMDDQTTIYIEKLTGICYISIDGMLAPMINEDGTARTWEQQKEIFAAPDDKLLPSFQ